MINRKSAYNMLQLIKSVVSDTDNVPFFTEDELSELLKTSQRHSLCAITAYALEKLGYYSEQFHEEKAKALRRRALIDIELRHISEQLNEKNIKFLKLKGVVLNKFYPKTYLREMVDVDILVDPARRFDVKVLMEGLGYKTVRYGLLNDDVYQKKDFFNFEMHSSLFDKYSNSRFYEYYRDIFDRLSDSENSDYEKFFSAEDLYIYLIIHVQKHFYNGGAGIKYLLDIYLFLKHQKPSFSWDYIYSEMKKLGLCEFEEQTRNLSLKVFNNQSLSTEESVLLDEYLLYGAHGSFSHYISIRTVGKSEKRGAARYIVKRVFPAANDLPEGYRFFYKHKTLLPFLWLYRFVRASVCYPSKVIDELKAVKRVEKENLDKDDNERNLRNNLYHSEKK